MSRARSKDTASHPVLPRVIRLPDPMPGPKAGPRLRYHTYIVVNGIPVHVMGERWRRKDAGACPSPTFPDPENPAIALAMCIEVEPGVAATIQVVSAEEYHVLVEAIRLGSAGLKAGTDSR